MINLRGIDERKSAAHGGPIQASPGDTQRIERAAASGNPRILLRPDQQLPGRDIMDAAEIAPEPLPGWKGLGDHFSIPVSIAVHIANHPVMIARRRQWIGQRAALDNGDKVSGLDQRSRSGQSHDPAADDDYLHQTLPRSRRAVPTTSVTD